MTLSGFQALMVLAVMCALFLRFGVVRESSRTEGTARSQGERTGDARNVPGACRDEVQS